MHDLEETMHFDPEEGIAGLDEHLDRLKDAAEAQGFKFDRHAARNELQAATFGNPDEPPQGAVNAKSPGSLSDPGPQNPELAKQFPSAQTPPATRPLRRGATVESLIKKI